MPLEHSFPRYPQLEINRCSWCGNDPLYVRYHDTEWGIPERNSQALFGKLILDGAQAGLSWITILKKRENYMKAFDGFNPVKMARYSDAKLESLMADPGIVRNRLKIVSARENARAFPVSYTHLTLPTTPYE